MEKNWHDLKIIQDFFQLEEDGTMPEGSRLLLDAMEMVTFERGQNIVTVGAEPDDGMYIILEGYTRVLSANGGLIGEQGPGEVIGELALIKDGVRKATVQAATPVSCANISRRLFEQLAEQNKKVYGALLELLYIKTTKAVQERERIRTELEIAAKIQAGFLPKSMRKFCQLPNVNIAVRTKPAKEVGGDFYDVFQIDENRLCFLIADVSGKGVPACMFMMVAKTHIKNYMMLDMPLAEVAARVNKQLNEDNEEELFVTVFLCMLDLRDNTLTFVNAGHNKPCISRAGGDFELLDCKVDFVFGIMDDMLYREQKVKLEPGDKLYLYTDGVTEAFDVHEKQFSEEWMLAELNHSKEIWDNPNEMLNRMYEAIATFSHGVDQSDDITMVYLAR